MRKYQLALIASIGEQTERWFREDGAPIASEALYRFLHTISGTAGVLGLARIGDTAGELMRASADRTADWPAAELQSFLEPLVDAADEASTNGSESNGTAPGYPTVVAFDDEPAFMTELRDYLERRGFRVVAAHDAEAALEAARSAKPDCVIAGGISQEPGAFGLLRQLRAEESASGEPGLPAIVVASAAEDSRPARIRAFRLGADDYVAKPVDMAELAARLNRQAERKRERDRLREISEASAREAESREEGTT